MNQTLLSFTTQRAPDRLREAPAHIDLELPAAVAEAIATNPALTLAQARIALGRTQAALAMGARFDLETLPGVRTVLAPLHNALKRLSDSDRPTSQAGLRDLTATLVGIGFDQLAVEARQDGWQRTVFDGLIVLKYAAIGKDRPIGRLADLARLSVALFDAAPADDAGNWLPAVLKAPFVVPEILSGSPVRNAETGSGGPMLLAAALNRRLDEILRLANTPERARASVLDHFSTSPGHVTHDNASALGRAVAALRQQFQPVTRAVRPRMALSTIAGVPVINDVSLPARVGIPVAAFGREVAERFDSLGIDGLLWEVAAPGTGDVAPGPVVPDPGPSLLAPSGRSDLLLVKETLTGYRRADIESVSNAMIGETRESGRSRRVTTEEELFESTQSISEQIEEVEESDRSSLRRAAVDIVKEQLSAAGSVTVSSRGPTKITAEGSVAYDRSTEESAERAEEFARGILRRAVERTHDTRLRTRRSLLRVETNSEDRLTFGLPSTAPDHVSGIYQYLERVSRAKIFSYGERDLYDLILPEPAALLWALSASQPDMAVAVERPDADLFAELSIDTIGIQLEEIIRAFKVFDIAASPPDEVNVSFATSQTGSGDEAKLAASKDVSIPEGYVATKANVSVNVETEGGISPNGSVTVGDQSQRWFIHKDALVGNVGSRTVQMPLGNLVGPQIPVAFIADNFASIAITVLVTCTLTPEARREWALKTFGKVTEAYERMRQDFEAAVKQATALNPEFDVAVPQGTRRRLQRVVRFEMQRLAIAAMRNAPPDFDLIAELPVAGATPPASHPITDNARQAEAGPEIRFLSQAFEWEHLSWVLYPYFWGRRTQWRRTVLQTHVDHEFGEFLRAGAARVQVPVTPGFEDLVKHYMETSEVYGGNDMPSMGDAHYVAFIDERSSASGAPGHEQPWPEGAPSEWDVVQPTEFVILREAGKPGLPAWDRDTGAAVEPV